MSLKNGKSNLSIMNRRKFLGCLSTAPLLGFSSSPAIAFFTTILSGQSEKAWASQLGESTRKFVMVHDLGGPCRFMFDQFFTPYSTAAFLPSPMISTQFKKVGGRYIGPDYVTHAIQGINVGTMWTHSVPAPGNTTRPMSDLLKNLLSVQGIDTNNPGHPTSVLWAQLPPGARRSALALAGDPASSPFAALDLGLQSCTYKSEVGKSSVRASLSYSQSSNPLSNLLLPFQTATSAPFNADKETLKTAYNSLLPLFDQLSKQGHVGAQSLIQNRTSTLALVETNFVALNDKWSTLFSKYQNLVNKALYDPANPLPGFNDLPIGEGGSGAMPQYQMLEGTSGSGAYPLHLASDVRSVVSSAALPNLAATFALTEYSLLQGLTNSIGFTLDQLSGLLHPLTLTGNFTMGNDQHSVGYYPTMYFGFIRFRALAACLLELISQLKAADMFKDTVIRYGGEFTRSTRPDLSGSDHGYQGAVYSHFSGAINGPVIVGNLLAGVTNNGTWGSGGFVPELGRNANLTDLLILLAHLIKTESPFTSDAPLVTLASDGTVSSRIGLTKYVAT